jgi:hypothetical protein
MNSSDASTGVAPKDDDSEIRLALAATVLAAAAFLVAASQAILEHFGSSGDSAKCTHEAIGAVARKVKRSWNFKFWKLRVYYPLLDLSSKEVLKTAAFNSVTTAIDAPSGPFRAIKRKRKGWEWHVMKERDDISFFALA